MTASLETRIFNISLATSCVVHIFALVSLIYSNAHYQRKPIKHVELIYQTIAEKPVPEKPPEMRDVKSIREKKLAPAPKVLAKRTVARQPALREMTKQPVRLDIHKKSPAKLSSLDGKRHISVPMLKSEKITNPKYVNYHEIIRTKIKNRAYLYVNDARFEAGDVYLTFVLGANGNLRDLKIINHKTRANDYLRGVGLRSIKESTPFPAFPPDLKYPELSFNVVISFEVDE